jgi:hypothetical protein
MKAKKPKRRYALLALVSPPARPRAAGGRKTRVDGSAPEFLGASSSVLESVVPVMMSLPSVEHEGFNHDRHVGEASSSGTVPEPAFGASAEFRGETRTISPGEDKIGLR